MSASRGGSHALPHTQPIIWAWDETFDVGLVRAGGIAAPVADEGRCGWPATSCRQPCFYVRSMAGPQTPAAETREQAPIGVGLVSRPCA